MSQCSDPTCRDPYPHEPHGNDGRRPVNGVHDLPPIERMQAVEVGPNDVIVVTVPEDVEQHEADRIRDALVEHWPNNRIAVLAESIELAVYRPEAQP